MIAWFARHQTAANLLMAAIMILGLVALPGLQRETFPEIQNDQVQVSVIYKGATADEVEDAVCRRIEEALETITDLDEMRCDAREGLGTATAVMLEGADMMRFLDDVKSEVDAIDDFPEQTEKPVIEELGRTDAVISVAVTGPEDPVALKAYAEDLKDRIKKRRRDHIKRRGIIDLKIVIIISQIAFQFHKGASLAFPEKEDLKPDFIGIE